MSDEANRNSLSRGSLLRVLPIEKRSSLRMEGRSFVRLTVDAALEIVSGISWRDREFPRAPISEDKQMCAIPDDVNLKIGNAIC